VPSCRLDCFVSDQDGDPNAKNRSHNTDHHHFKEHVMPDPATTVLMNSNLNEIFGQRDPPLRREAIARTYTEDVAFTDESGTIVGHSAIDDRVQQLLQDAPASFSFAPDGPIYVGEDTAALAWRLGPPDSQPVARGIDIATVKEGRISAIRTLLS
jgi:hypothetical protein